MGVGRYIYIAFLNSMVRESLTKQVTLKLKPKAKHRPSQAVCHSVYKHSFYKQKICQCLVWEEGQGVLCDCGVVRRGAVEPKEVRGCERPKCVVHWKQQGLYLWARHYRPSPTSGTLFYQLSPSFYIINSLLSNS